MASAVPLRSFHLAVIGLACLLPTSAATGNGIAATTTEQLHAAVLPHDTTAATWKALLLHALPLLAVPFLPTPLAALVALSALTTPVRAGRLSTNETCPGREHATCTVYRYLPDERAFSGTCSCGQGRPFHSFCRVRTLELDDGAERINFRVLPGHQTTIADPCAAAASGEDVCYVELEHGNHREGYYILCPVRKCPFLRFLCCPEIPHGAAAVVPAAA